MRVVIAEDNALLREGLTQLLDGRGFDVAAAVADGPSLVAAVVKHHPDIAVVDVRMPPTFRDEGLRACLEARRLVPQTAVMILSQYVEQSYAAELLRGGGGGIGYLLKDRVADVRDFVDALRRVAAGGTAMDPEVVAQLIARGRPQPLDTLTPRERQVLGLIAEGRSNAAIATALRMPEGGVEKHITSIFAKLALPDSADDHRRVLAVLAFLNA